jgi:hypothetical protein
MPGPSAHGGEFLPSPLHVAAHHSRHLVDRRLRLGRVPGRGEDGNEQALHEHLNRDVDIYVVAGSNNRSRCHPPPSAA